MAIFYVQVDDVKAAIARAESLGASVAVPFADNGAIEFADLRVAAETDCLPVSAPRGWR
ncbi:MAG TPA: hypothetical protein VLT34_01690 [Arthrobacter sp.]|nr:hypothetical protein [Arthrobacter sp.]